MVTKVSTAPFLQLFFWLFVGIKQFVDGFCLGKLMLCCTGTIVDLSSYHERFLGNKQKMEDFEGCVMGTSKIVYMCVYECV